MNLNPTEASLRARAAAYAAHARHGGKAMTAAGRGAFLATFEKRVDPTNTLAPEERRRRAQHLLKSHMTALALRSARARRRPLGENDAA
jgi:hypothetical protein